MPVSPTRAYVAVRLTEGREWLDTGSLVVAYPGAAQDCLAKAAALDNSIPGWAKHNPVVRVASVVLSECESLNGPYGNWVPAAAGGIPDELRGAMPGPEFVNELMGLPKLMGLAKQ